MAKVSNQKIWRPKASFTTFLKCWTLEYELTRAKIHKIISKEKVLFYINLKSKIWNKYLKRMKYWRSINFKNEIMRVK